jgi:hypothetical protein
MDSMSYFTSGKECAVHQHIVQVLAVFGTWLERETQKYEFIEK